MFRASVVSVCASCQLRLHLLRSTSTNRAENQRTVDSLYELSVDVRKVRKFKGWVLSVSPAYVSETAALLRDMGADGAVIARVLEAHPEAVLCRPEEVAAQHHLWASVCPNRRALLSIVEKFPASFFTVSHHGNQQANVLYLQSLRLNKKVISKLMASAPQSFSRPVERNKEVIHTLRDTYLGLGGDEPNLRIWLQKLLSQNPYILLRPPEAWRHSLGFLRGRGFSTEELLCLVSKLRASISELEPGAMQQALDYLQGALSCSEEELKQAVVRCPAVLHYPLPVLVSRLQGLLDAGAGAEQVKASPNVLELTTPIVLYRVKKLAAFGYDVRAGSLDVIVGCKKEFEASCARLNLRRQRPIFNPVAPLRSSEE